MWLEDFQKCSSIAGYNVKDYLVFHIMVEYHYSMKRFHKNMNNNINDLYYHNHHHYHQGLIISHSYNNIEVLHIWDHVPWNLNKCK